MGVRPRQPPHPPSLPCLLSVVLRRAADALVCARAGVLACALAVVSAAAAAPAAPVTEVVPAPAAPAAAPAAAGGGTCPPTPDPREGGPAVDRGMLWKITRAGRVSYLFGTVHVGRPAWRLFGPRTAAALAQVDTIALELDPTDPAVIAALGLGPPGPALPGALQQRLAEATERACLPPAALATLHPVLQAITLTVLDARWLGMDPAWSLEVPLAQRARAARRQLVSLEDAERQRTALVPSDPAEAQAVVEQNLRQLEDRSSRRVVARLVEAWERGDLDALGNYGQWCECKADEQELAALRRLNDHRNPHLADRIAALHSQGRRVFAAVGALHMTGPRALPRLLAERGFRVERVAFAR